MFSITIEVKQLIDYNFHILLGYDNELGNYHCVLHDHLAYRYEILDMLGMGSYGQVVKVRTEVCKCSSMYQGQEDINFNYIHTHVSTSVYVSWAKLTDVNQSTYC
jgi:hypothetical protein